ncbi:hypothetical protein ACIBL5_18160 [Streptomyces sp. NPDC050516]|uniref:hypothetical protein n=1 Tax=Streptomyces sp. NPDC050516 TaxID=3365621 RepID=UPI0037A29294
MQTNTAMAGLLARIDVSGLGADDVPAPFRDVVRRGWTTSPGGARLLAALVDTTHGTYVDAVQEEYSVNGRGMSDEGLPASGPERERALLRRCLAYARLALLGAHERFGDARVKGYVSLSTGGFYEDTVTAYVTFCAEHPGLPRYLGPIEGYEEEAVAELVLDDFEA